MFAGNQSADGDPTLAVRRLLIGIEWPDFEEVHSLDRMSLFIERLHAHLAGDLEREILDKRFFGIEDNPPFATLDSRNEAETAIAVDLDLVLAGKPDPIEVIAAVAVGRRLLDYAIGDVDQLDRRVGDRFSLLVDDAAAQRRIRAPAWFPAR